ncbi:MAG: ROK family transcriptional regulator [Bryobacteraceae bacterium]|nr:ROK family transcriptional regulator [Bryobacteraceae bacterium]
MVKVQLTSRSPLLKSHLREANERLLLNMIRQNADLSRADIVRITGFSASSVTYIIKRMIKAGLVCETPSNRPARVGRQPLTLRLKPEALIAAGVEILGTGARVITADLHGNFLAQRFVPWELDHIVFLVRVRDAIRALTSNLGGRNLLGVGVSLPGSIDRANGRVIAAENLGWFDVDAGGILSQGSSVSFYYGNDAHLGALAERWFCEPGTRPLENFVYVILRQGLGTGVMVDGSLLRGATGEASEFGHTTLFADGRRCLCGSVGCWEEYASQRALERLFAEKAGLSNGSAEADAEQIIRLAREGDRRALSVLEEVAGYLGMGFANINAALNPEAIVVGDYLASAWDLMKDWVWDTLRSRAPQRQVRLLRIFPSRHGADSTLLGTVALVLSTFFNPSAESRPAA